MVISKKFAHIEDAKKFIGDAVRFCSDRELSPFYNAGGERQKHDVERWDWLSVGTLLENMDALLKKKKGGTTAISGYDFFVNVEYTNISWYVHIDFWRLGVNSNIVVSTDQEAIVSYIRVHFHNDEKFHPLIDDIYTGKIHSNGDAFQKVYLMHGEHFNEIALITAVPSNAESIASIGWYLFQETLNYFINPDAGSERFFLELFRSDAMVRK